MSQNAGLNTVQILHCGDDDISAAAKKYALRPADHHRHRVVPDARHSICRRHCRRDRDIRRLISRGMPRGARDQNHHP
jgi:hypothetical protein